MSVIKEDGNNVFQSGNNDLSVFKDDNTERFKVKDYKGNEEFLTETAPVLDELPSLDASKAGDYFWYLGNLWTYAQENQFGSLAVGTPFPVRGYKIFSFSANAGSPGFSQIFKDEIFESTPTLTNRFANVRTFNLSGLTGRFEILNTYTGSNFLISTLGASFGVANINGTTVTLTGVRITYASNTIINQSEFGTYELRQYPPS